MSDLARRNARIGRMAALLVAAMVGLAFASVPLYRVFCQVTGFDGTTRRAAAGTDAPGAVVGKIVSVRFDSNIGGGLPWSFEPEQRTERVAIGARKLAFFEAKNLSNHSITGRATFNVSPPQAGQYFTKIQCFCFTEQTLKPGEQVRMPVVYYIDPKFIDDPDANTITEITLSYTFYPVDSAEVQG